jgi:hypothetical protein
VALSARRYCQIAGQDLRRYQWGGRIDPNSNGEDWLDPNRATRNRPRFYSSIVLSTAEIPLPDMDALARLWRD